MTLNLPVEKICKEYQDGISASKLAKKHKCNINTIHTRLYNNNIKIRSVFERQELNKGKNNLNYINLPIEQICKDYQDGMSAFKLSEKYNCSESTIKRRLRVNNIEIRSISESKMGLQTGIDNPCYVEIPIDELCKKYLNGMNMVELAKEYKCSYATIFDRLYNNGIDIVLESRKHHSASQQGIPYNEWEGFISEQKYCSLFNEKFKEKVRKLYNRRCFMCGKSEEKNGRKQDIHHVNYDKDCLCGNKCEFVPLCQTCHPKTNHNRKYWEDLIMNYLYPNRYFMVEI